MVSMFDRPRLESDWPQCVCCSTSGGGTRWDSLSLSLSLSPEKENLGLERREERTGLCRPHQDQARPNHQGPKLHNSENIPTPLELSVSYLFFNMYLSPLLGHWWSFGQNVGLQLLERFAKFLEDKVKEFVCK